MKNVIGPMPHRAVAAPADLGLSEHEIARYFGVPVDEITAIQRTADQGFEGGSAGAGERFGSPASGAPDTEGGLK